MTDCQTETLRRLVPGPPPEPRPQAVRMPPAYRFKAANPAIGLDIEAGKAIREDPRLTSAVRTWAACMKRKGFGEFADPSDAAYEFHNDDSANVYGQGPRPYSKEVRVARADGACNKEADLEAVWVAVATGHQRKLIDRDRASLLAALKWWDGYAAGARRLLGT